MCYEVCISNNPSNLLELQNMGFKGFENIPESSPYIGIQLNTKYVVGRSYVGWSCPHIRIKYLPSILVLPTTLARIEYMYEEFLIDQNTYEHMKQVDRMIRHEL